MIILPTKTIFIGKIFQQYDVVESTNTLAFELTSKNNPIEGTAIYAHFQTAGKGQIGSYWNSKAGMNLLTSVILTPSFLDLKDQFYLNIITSLAVCDTLEDLGINNAMIKWPNDIYVGDKKICGILVQSLLEKARMKYAVIGIGLNINQKSWPTEIPNPISASQDLGKDLDLSSCLSSLYQKLEYRYLSLKRERNQLLKEEYLSLLYQKDKFCTYESGGKRWMGSIRGIDEIGRLQIEDSEGGLKAFDFRGVKFC